MKPMKTIILLFFATFSISAFSQIQQNVNKTTGTVSKPITQIDSIRFNTNTNQMEIIQTNGNAGNHVISDITNVTFSGQLVGTIATLGCGTATNNGILTAYSAASSVSSSIPYTGGNGGPYNGQTVNSTGVTGLTATLNPGTFTVGSGNLTYTITGSPSAAGTANFALIIGGQTCNFSRTVAAPEYPAGSIFCASGATAIVEVTNPATGRIWMDRNLGATQVATSSTDANAYGDLYQWGRGADGHQCRNSATTSTLSSIDQPTHGSFILAPNYPYDWRSPQNTNLWQGLNGFNSICPSGYRLPTESEMNSERLSWSSNNISGAFASPLKLTLSGYRNHNDGLLYIVNFFGSYWTSSVYLWDSRYLSIGNVDSSMDGSHRANGASVRCIKN